MSFTLNRPETIEDARKIRYNKSGANPGGTPYREGYCAESVASRERAIRFWQCQRKAVVGIWCRQHSPRGSRQT